MTSLDRSEARGVELQRQLDVLSTTNAELLRANESLVLAGARYLVLHDLAPTPLVTVDQVGDVGDVNHAAELLLGMPRVRMLGRRFGSFVDETMKLAMERHLRALFSNGTMSSAGITLSRDGAPIEVLIEGVVLPDRGPLRAVLACVDVTARRRDEAARQLVAKRAGEAQRLESLGVLAGGIAHDFNNLMTIVLAGTEYVLDDLGPGSRHGEPLAEVQQAARHAADLAKQMLAYSGHVSVPAHAINLASLVLELEPLVRATAQSTPVVFDLTAHHACVAGDEPQLRQVVLNLVLNAAEAMAGRLGAITVTVRVDPASGDGARVVLEVSDAGIGMSPETTARIFDPYYSTKFAGRGLGLAVVHGVVRAHGGGIEVESSPGHGTTVRIAFPAVAAPPAPVAAPSDVAWRGRGTVLVVDDEEHVRRALARAVRKLGLSVVPVATGEAALEVLREQPCRIDLVMTDLTMPGMAGVALARAIRALHADLPIILVTGYGEIPEACEQVFTSALAKPFELAAVRAALQQHLPAATS